MNKKDRLDLRSREKDWGAYFDSPTRGCLPDRSEPPLDQGDELTVPLREHPANATGDYRLTPGAGTARYCAAANDSSRSAVLVSE